MIRARVILALALGIGGGLLGATALRAAGKSGKSDAGAEQRKALAGLNGDDKGDPANKDDSGDDTSEPRRDGAEGMMADSHVVKKGDTLWSICDAYFHDPWRWPKVWALNPDVSNPHWIFPGQTIKLGAISHSTPGAADSAEPAAEPEHGEKEHVGIVRAKTSVSFDNGMLREVGFVDTHELAFAGTINGSREEKIMLGSGDQAYVQFSQARPLKAGERFTVYQIDESNPVREPGSSLTIGYLVRMYGDITIDALTDRPIASATLVNLVEPVERGYRVGPIFKQFKTVTPRKNEIDTTGRVVAAIAPNLLISQNMFVVLNRGSRHGVELGNRFMVIRQGDGYRPVMENWMDMDHRFPPDSVAALLVVDVREETSMAWVSDGNREVRIGDVADMRKGY